jgi:hypothetical protein
MTGVAAENEIAQMLESRPISLPLAKPPALNPPGGGAIRGIDEKFAVDPVTGADHPGEPETIRGLERA